MNVIPGAGLNLLFDLRYDTLWAPDSRAAFFNSSSNSPRYDRFSNVKIVHAVTMTPHAQIFFVRKPL
jgi:hypothetical protein